MERWSYEYYESMNEGCAGCNAENAAGCPDCYDCYPELLMLLPEAKRIAYYAEALRRKLWVSTYRYTHASLWDSGELPF
jgi:hypothetical protein